MKDKTEDLGFQRQTNKGCKMADRASLAGVDENAFSLRRARMLFLGKKDIHKGSRSQT